MIIYKFEHNGNIYIGSTKDLTMRCHAHNQHKKQARHNKTDFYQYLIENDIQDIRPHTVPIKEIDEDYNKNLLRSIEQDIIDEYQPNLNMISAMKR
tara:strand:+ start:93 stop:380 length:288 start_codon:yes stop_codon:yes gene_type:complete